METKEFLRHLPHGLCFQRPGLAIERGLGIFFPAKMNLLKLGWTQKTLDKNFGLGILGFAACFMALGLTLEILGFRTFRDLTSSFIDQAPGQRLAYLLIGIHAAFLEESVLNIFKHYHVHLPRVY